MFANQKEYWGTDYYGPGDIVPNAAGWWGLRAYSGYVIGTNAVRLRRSSDNAEQDFATIAGGGLDLSAISTFKGAANLFVVKLYDQIGTAHLEQATAANQPPFLLAFLGAYPTMDLSGSVNLQTTGAFARSAPYSWVAVVNGSTTFQGSILESVGPPIQFLTKDPDLIYCFDIGNGGAVAAAENTWHTAACTQSGGTDSVFVDTVETTGTPFGGGTAMSGAVRTGPQMGRIMELGIYPVKLSSANAIDLDANQTAYWGF